MLKSSVIRNSSLLTSLNVKLTRKKRLRSISADLNENRPSKLFMRMSRQKLNSNSRKTAKEMPRTRP